MAVSFLWVLGFDEWWENDLEDVWLWNHHYAL